jgi:hypothetical protein
LFHHVCEGGREILGAKPAEDRHQVHLAGQAVALPEAQGDGAIPPAEDGGDAPPGPLLARRDEL